jgi:DNA-binding beta-propeller fold protein YncE
MTIDTATNTFIGQVAAGVDPRWMARGPGGKYMYVSNTGSSSVSLLALAH